MNSLKTDALDINVPFSWTRMTQYINKNQNHTLAREELLIILCYKIFVRISDLKEVESKK